MSGADNVKMRWSVIEMVDVRLVSFSRDGERLVAAAAKQTVKRVPVLPGDLSEEEVEAWIRELFRRQHWSPLEFSWYVFLVDGCSRVCSHQLVRHRVASYAQLSQRWSEGRLRAMALRACRELGLECPEKPRRGEDFLAYARALEKYRNVYGLSARLASDVGELEASPLVSLASEAFVIPERLPPLARAELAVQYISATASYYRLLSIGVRKEDARFVLPQSVKTTIYVAMNARELATVFLPLRMCTRAQWEIRRLAWAMWRVLVRVHPRIFRYVGPRCVLLENSVRDQPLPLEVLVEEGFTIPRCPELVPREGIRNCVLSNMRRDG